MSLLVMTTERDFILPIWNLKITLILSLAIWSSSFECKLNLRITFSCAGMIFPELYEPPLQSLDYMSLI